MFDAVFQQALREHLDAVEPAPRRRRSPPSFLDARAQRQMGGVIRRFAATLDWGAFFALKSRAGLPLVMAVLDAELECTATLPAATAKAVDPVFVCRKPLSRKARQLALPLDLGEECRIALAAGVRLMHRAGVSLSSRELDRLLAGHVARLTIQALCPTWDGSISPGEKKERASGCLEEIARVSVEARAPARRKSA